MLALLQKHPFRQGDMVRFLYTEKKLRACAHVLSCSCVCTCVPDSIKPVYFFLCLFVFGKVHWLNQDSLNAEIPGFPEGHLLLAMDTLGIFNRKKG